MRPKSIAPKTEVINFHIDSEQKALLRAFAEKRGKGFSELVRMAIAEYLETLQEEEDLLKLRGDKLEGYIDLYEAATKAVESPLLLLGELPKEEILKMIDINNAYLLNAFEGFPKLKELEGHSSSKTFMDRYALYGELITKLLSMKRAIFRKQASFLGWMHDWSNRMNRLQYSITEILSSISNRDIPTPGGPVEFQKTSGEDEK